MKLYTTVKELKEKNACYSKEQWEDFMIKMDLTSEEQPFDITSGLKIAGIKDCVWALRTQKGKAIAAFVASVANLVLPIYQKKYPSDRRVQRCISLTFKYAVNLCSREELREAAYTATDATDATDAAYAATEAAYAATDAAYATAYAACVAADMTNVYAKTLERSEERRVGKEC